MKIALLGPCPPFRGGIAHFNALLYESLIDRHEVQVINFRRQYPNILFPGTSQFDHSVPVEPAFLDRLFDPLNPATWYRAYRKVRSWDPHLLIFSYWMPFFAPGLGTTVRLVRRNTQTRNLCLVHNLTPHEHRPGDRALNRYLTGSVDSFIVLSGTVKKQLLTLAVTRCYCSMRAPLFPSLR